MTDDIDIRENDILLKSRELLRVLLIDRTKSLLTGKVSNIIWGTKNYQNLGYKENDEISIDAISGENGEVIQPRTKKSKSAQKDRSREKAEVFTPSWLCNKQNNLIDDKWFGRKGVFNSETEFGWKTQHRPIPFRDKDGKRWQDYVAETRLEITCGEAPYLASRYDTITGAPIAINDRIGLLDRKLRVVCENTTSIDDWKEWALIALKSIYAFEWQGDNLILARENLLYSLVDYYKYKFGVDPNLDYLQEAANVVSWNVWQMDGIKAVIPGTCHTEVIEQGGTLFEPFVTIERTCEGCDKDDIHLHNGIACYIMDWEKNHPVLFSSLLNS